MNTTRTLIAGAAAMLLAAPAFAQQDDQTSQSGQSASQQSASQGAQGQSAQAMQRDPQMVRQIQQKLQDQGYEVGEIDGMWGPKTANALKEFQRAQGMQADGKLSQGTISALGMDMQGGDSMATDQSQTSGAGTATGAAEGQDATGATDDPTRGAGGQGGAGTGAGAGAGTGAGTGAGAGGTGAGGGAAR